MNDDCVIHFTKPATKDMLAVAKKDAKRAAILRALLAQIEENGWKLSTHSQAIRFSATKRV